MNTALFFESTGDERATPQDFFDRVHAEFGFTLDAAASTLNHKCELWFGEGGLAFDALTEDWGGEGSVVWCNPPYSAAGAFVAKAKAEAAKGATVVLLLPARTDTRWWHAHVWDQRTHAPQPDVQVRLIPGRLTFELHVSDELRALVKANAPQDGDTAYDEAIKSLVEQTGLPKMAIEGIRDGKPDEDLLSSAPFPSALVVFTGVRWWSTR